jgi:MFS family permease
MQQDEISPITHAETTPLISSPTINADDPEPKKTLMQRYWHRRFYNVVMVALGMLFINLAWQTTQNYMTTFHKDAGFWSLTIVYVLFALSSYITPILVNKLGPRLSLVLSGIPFSVIVLVAGLENKSKIPLYVASFFVGVGGSLKWTAQGVSTVSYSLNKTDMGHYECW